MATPIASTPTRVWARFLVDEDAPASELSSDCRVDRYEVNDVCTVRGAPLAGVPPKGRVTRIESPSQLASGKGGLIGVMQHVLYTEAAERRELLVSSAAESGPMAVLIPITKSKEWWSLAQDERRKVFLGVPNARGHLAIGTAFAARIFRRLYHSRYLPGADWDFLTYFEFPEEHADAFRNLLAELRDPAQNPEWASVEREAEIWMTKLA